MTTATAHADDLKANEGKDEALDEILAEIQRIEKELEKRRLKLEKELGYVSSRRRVVR